MVNDYDSSSRRMDAIGEKCTRLLARAIEERSPALYRKVVDRYGIEPSTPVEVELLEMSKLEMRGVSRKPERNLEVRADVNLRRFGRTFDEGHWRIGSTRFPRRLIR